MKKLFNLRIPVLLTCASVAGIALGYLLFFYNYGIICIAALVLSGAAIFIFCAIAFKNIKLLSIIALSTLVIVCGALNCYFRLYGYVNSGLDDGGQYSITATVKEKGQNSYGEYLIADDIRADGKKVSGKIKINLASVYGDFCEEGYNISFYAKINRNDAFSYARLNYNAARDIRYTCSVYGGLKAEYRFSLFGSIRSAIRKTLYNNIDGDTAAIALAMLTGNTQGVESGELEAFRYGGIAHIFAVSGLHIGIVYGLFLLICKKLRLNKYLAAAICIFFIFFYAGICAFTLSSLRAAVMCAINSLARLIYQKYDSLNSLAAAVFLLLCITPLSLFSVGFQLSVCAVAGIIFISKQLSRLFKRLPQKISGAAAVSLSAQAGTMPVMLADFGYISGAGLLLNIVVVPILSAIYSLLFACTLLSVIFPFSAPFILPCATLPLQLFITCFMNGAFERALLSGFGAGGLIILYYVLLLILSDKLNLKLLYRLSAAGCATVLLFGCILGNRLISANGVNISVSAYYGGGQIVVRTQNKNILIVTERLNTTGLRPFLNENFITVPDAVIILGGENCALNYDTEINCKSLYVYGGHINIQPYKNVEIHYENKFDIGGASFEFADGNSIAINCDGIKTAVCAGGEIPFDDCDLIISDCFANGKAPVTVGFNRRGNEYCIYDDGNINFKIKDNKLSGGK